MCTLVERARKKISNTSTIVSLKKGIFLLAEGGEEEWEKRVQHREYVSRGGMPATLAEN